MINQFRVLLIDLSPGHCDCLGEGAFRPDIVWERAIGLEEGVWNLRHSLPNAAVARFEDAEEATADIVEALVRSCGESPLAVWAPGISPAHAVRLSRCGAWQVFGDLTAATLCDELAQSLEEGHRLARRHQNPTEEPWRNLLVGESRAMQRVAQVIRLVGSKRCTVLIGGETGTGKEMAARAIHMASPRSRMPMVAVNCSALPENLLEAELFGHVKGAYTGATTNRTGRFEQAHQGTLFLDEIGDIPLDLQAKLLRVLQEREFQRLGNSGTVRVDVRVVAASNADLAERVRQGRFREDLYYRLNVVPLIMPPLRERRQDIPLLTRHFIDKICRLEGIPPKTVHQETLARLSACPWPGNVRQLENAVEMAVAMSGDRAALHSSDFPLSEPPLAMGEFYARRMSGTAPAMALPEDGLDFEMAVSDFERNILEQALRKTQGNKTMAADMLRLKRTTLTAKLRSLEVGIPC